MLAEKYDAFYSEAATSPLSDISLNRWPRNRLEAVVGVPGNGDSLLDIGCGNGYLLYQFRNRYNQLIGVEYSSERLKQATQNLATQNFTPILGSAEDLQAIPDNSIDRVTCSDVIEHIPDVYTAVAEVHRILKPDGIFVVNTPNIAYIKRRIQLLLGRFPSTSQGNEGLGSDVLFDGGHLHYFTFRSLELLLKRHSFRITESSGYGKFGWIHSVAPRLTSNGIQLVAKKA